MVHDENVTFHQLKVTFLFQRAASLPLFCCYSNQTCQLFTSFWKNLPMQLPGDFVEICQNGAHHSAKKWNDNS